MCGPYGRKKGKEGEAQKKKQKKKNALIKRNLLYSLIRIDCDRLIIHMRGHSYFNPNTLRRKGYELRHAAWKKETKEGTLTENEKHKTAKKNELNREKHDIFRE